jgi:hypothetical protein
MPYAESATVPIEKTIAEIEATVMCGVGRFAYWTEGAAEVPTRR